MGKNKETHKHRRKNAAMRGWRPRLNYNTDINFVWTLPKDNHPAKLAFVQSRQPNIALKPRLY